jgi:hypothetical protein
MAKCALVCGAGGFIGGHLVKRFKRDGFWVRGVDLKYHEFSETESDDFLVGDLRDRGVCHAIVDRRFDEVYQLAADMGGAGYIFIRRRRIANTDGKSCSASDCTSHIGGISRCRRMSHGTTISSGPRGLGQAVVRRRQPRFVAKLRWPAVATRSRCGAMANRRARSSISTSASKPRRGCCALTLPALSISGRRKW